MKKLFLLAIAIFLTSGVFAQTLDTEALAAFPASTARDVYEVCRYVKLDAGQQRALAAAFVKEDSCMLDMIHDAGGVLTVKDSRRIARMRDSALAGIMSQEQLEQYYRGVFDKEADAEGIAIADRLQKKYGLTDQNWKFIRVAFYKIGLDSRVIAKVMADRPAKAKKRIEELRQAQLATIEAKGGIRVNPAGTTVTVIKPFDPNKLHRE